VQQSSRVLLSLLGTLFLLGCPPKGGTSDGGDDAGVDGGVDAGSREATLSQYAEALCSYYDRCESVRGRASNGHQACVEYWSAAAVCDPNVKLVDDATISACAARLDATTDCANDIDDPTSPCVKVWTGNRIANENEACHDKFCNFGLYCKSSSQGGVCPVCKTEATTNEACNNSADPTVRLPCNKDNYCNNGTCAALKTAGAQCSGADQCATKFCKNNLCTEPIALGQPCTASDVCAGEFRVCIGGVCSDRRLPGESCTTDSQCLDTDICDNGVCTRYQACTKRAVGEQCNGTFECASGSYCDFDSASGDFRCFAVTTQVGQPCTQNVDQCGAENFCDLTPDPPLCTARIAIGQSCPGAGCVSGAFCNTSDICVAFYENGQACADYTECKSQVCQNGFCAEQLTCQMP
jgi:hypothetical protein